MKKQVTKWEKECIIHILDKELYLKYLNYSKTQRESYPIKNDKLFDKTFKMMCIDINMKKCSW